MSSFAFVSGKQRLQGLQVAGQREVVPFAVFVVLDTNECNSGDDGCIICQGLKRAALIVDYPPERFEPMPLRRSIPPRCSVRQRLPNAYATTATKVLNGFNSCLDSFGLQGVYGVKEVASAIDKVGVGVEARRAR